VLKYNKIKCCHSKTEWLDVRKGSGRGIPFLAIIAHQQGGDFSNKLVPVHLDKCGMIALRANIDKVLKELERECKEVRNVAS
jgi:hypothetical protein